MEVGPDPFRESTVWNAYPQTIPVQADLVSGLQPSLVCLGVEFPLQISENLLPHLRHEGDSRLDAAARRWKAGSAHGLEPWVPGSIFHMFSTFVENKELCKVLVM
jgi:hypothetical protein